MNARRVLVDAPWILALGAVARRITTGSIDVTMPDGRTHRYAGGASGPAAAIVVRDAAAARRAVTGGSVGFAEGYMEGEWDSPDLDMLLRFALANASAWETFDVLAPLQPILRRMHRGRDNDLDGSRRNIEHHYDLGNEFYRLWLDDTMAYSAACFEAPGEDLATAQRRKWDRMLELVQPRSRDHLLEIGCGWGGFAVHAAREAGCRVTGLTLSPAQAESARQAVTEAGLDDRVDIRLRDYRQEPGTYRGIVSIEMFEAVGERWWPTFFGRVRGLLEPGCAAAMQVITIAEESFEAYRRTPDFTQRHIFPGGMLPSVPRFRASAAAAGLRVGEPRLFGADYARTLAEWARRFERVLPEVRAQGFDERFVRMWRYYLSYCRAGFESGNIDVMQVRLKA